jgi:predicted RNase H-like HicB family nuclease
MIVFNIFYNQRPTIAGHPADDLAPVTPSSIFLMSKNKGMIRMHRFLIVFEKVRKNYSAYSPDLSGCIATGKTREEAEERMHEAIEMHIQGLVEDGLPVPKSPASASIGVSPDVNKV